MKNCCQTENQSSPSKTMIWVKRIIWFSVAVILLTVVVNQFSN